MKTDIAIIVPVYNEADNLQILLPSILSNTNKSVVFVVDDNSNDNTTNVIDFINKKGVKRVIHIKRKAKMGRGTAVLHGFSYALKNTNARYFVEMDADLSHDPKELPALLKLVDKNSIGIASRYLKKSKIVNIPTRRKILSKFANTLNSVLFGLPIKDNTNGYRAYPRQAIELLLNYKYKSTGFVTISESTYFLYKNGYTLKEKPTKFVNRSMGGSKADLHEIFISVRDLLKIRFS